MPSCSFSDDSVDRRLLLKHVGWGNLTQHHFLPMSVSYGYTGFGKKHRAKNLADFYRISLILRRMM